MYEACANECECDKSKALYRSILRQLENNSCVDVGSVNMDVKVASGATNTVLLFQSHARIARHIMCLLPVGVPAYRVYSKQLSFYVERFSCRVFSE